MIVDIGDTGSVSCLHRVCVKQVTTVAQARTCAPGVKLDVATDWTLFTLPASKQKTALLLWSANLGDPKQAWRDDLASLAIRHSVSMWGCRLTVLSLRILHFLKCQVQSLESKKPVSYHDVSSFSCSTDQQVNGYRNWRAFFGPPCPPPEKTNGAKKGRKILKQQKTFAEKSSALSALHPGINHHRFVICT